MGLIFHMCAKVQMRHDGVRKLNSSEPIAVSSAESRRRSYAARFR